VCVCVCVCVCETPPQRLSARSKRKLKTGKEISRQVIEHKKQVCGAICCSLYDTKAPAGHYRLSVCFCFRACSCCSLMFLRQYGCAIRSSTRKKKKRKRCLGMPITAQHSRISTAGKEKRNTHTTLVVYGAPQTTKMSCSFSCFRHALLYIILPPT
jgi:hypothetical protein